MNKDLEAFENRSDDWLAKERKREALVSAWDLDEGYRLKKEHIQNCEARQIKEEHEIKHEYYDRISKHRRDRANNQFQQVDSNKALKVFAPIFLVMILIIMIGAFAASGLINVGEIGFAIPIIIFILLVNLLPKRRK